ncbi:MULTISPECIES: hypothetical protein [unclassified Burkholderia]|uniref:hypothetical protein n=1 Tax=unclassified Burkholderia TaxID=2613784 RepID=UPI00075B097F|nr:MULTISPECIES: hypothetical protein [unclassified Burkholderia]KVN17966.1 hypothetical protein WT08_02220 [Burkholderia sp. MSMB1552]KWZ55484.1 hypothetical protein WS92_05860 [Burkholderia sp. MSMB1588]
MKITKGQIIAFTEGVYSDYCLRDHMRALDEFETDDKFAEFKLTPEFKASSFREREDLFMAWLVKTGAVEPLDDEVTEWHITSHRGFYSE